MATIARIPPNFNPREFDTEHKAQKFLRKFAFEQMGVRPDTPFGKPRKNPKCAQTCIQTNAVFGSSHDIDGKNDSPTEAAGVRVLRMKKTATVLKFKSKRLKTPKDVQAVELAVLEDLRSGAVTAREAREIHIQIAAMLKRFVDGKIEAKENPSRIVRGIRLKLPM